jgi:hypothetical protein
MVAGHLAGAGFSGGLTFKPIDNHPEAFGFDPAILASLKLAIRCFELF